MKDLVVLGTGNIDIVRLIEDINKASCTYNFLGFLEKDKSLIGKDYLGYKVIGDDSLLLSSCKHCSVVVNIVATTQLHMSIFQKLLLLNPNIDFPNLIHPGVDLRGVEIGHGNIIYNRASILTRTTIGNYNILYGGAAISHEAIVGDSNLLSKVIIGSRVSIGNCNLFGTNSVIANNVKVGNNNEIGVGSVVMKNVGNDEWLLGYPAIDAKIFYKQHFYKK